MGTQSKIELEQIKALVLDVDGVLTEGTLVINSDGSESKHFNSHDGHGIRLWQRAGLKTAFLSGRTSSPTVRRAEQLGVDKVYQECHFKLPVMKQFLEEMALAPENVAYMGDDLPDLPVIRFVGFGVAVANAVSEVKRYADYVTERSGGRGAVREVIEHILKAGGRWEPLMERYIA